MSFQCYFLFPNISDNKSSQVSRTLLSILADLSNTVVWIISIRPLFSKSSSPCTNPLVAIQRAPTTIGITVSFMNHSFFNFLARFRYLSFFSLSFKFTLGSVRTEKTTILQVYFPLFFFLVDYSKVWSSGRD